MLRERLQELEHGNPEGPVTATWQRFYVERVARRLLDDGASRMNDLMREAEAGAALLDQLEAAR